jgi:hypothetical protein
MLNESALKRGGEERSLKRLLKKGMTGVSRSFFLALRIGSPNSHHRPDHPNPRVA